MRIDRLTIKNFKCFAEHTFTFERSADAPEGTGSFHVLIGQNGHGKTSALDAAAVAVGSWFLGVRGEDTRHIKPEDVRLKVIDFGDTQRIEHLHPVVVEAEGLVQGTPLRWKRELAGEGGRTTRGDARALKLTAEETVAAMREGEPVTLPLISYYGTGRLWQEPKDMQKALEAGTTPVAESDEELSKAFNSRLAGYRNSIDPRCSPRELLRWLSLEQRLARDEGAESTQFRVVKEAIQKGVEGCQGVKVHARLGLLLQMNGVGWMPFGVLSDGQRNIVAMIGDLAFKAAQLNPHLGPRVLTHTPGVVLIDELDLHLHPHWQRHIAEDLRGTFPGLQFIVTTHSPFIVQSARAGEIVSLDSQTVDQTGNLGIEEIARGLMQVERPDVSSRYEEMVTAAKQYLVTLDEAAKAPDDKLREYIHKLSESVAPYADNPAFQAFLEMKREAKLGARTRQEG